MTPTPEAAVTPEEKQALLRDARWALRALVRTVADSDLSKVPKHDRNAINARLRDAHHMLSRLKAALEEDPDELRKAEESE
jgi:hypothetical protein